MCDFCGCKYGFTAESVGVGQDDLYEDDDGILHIKDDDEYNPYNEDMETP